MSSLKKKVLVVDDEKELAEIIAANLEESGFDVKTASSVLEALSIHQASPVDFVLSDVRMPGGSGFDLLKALRHLHPANPPVAFLTGFSDLSSDEAYQQGAVALLLKPCQMTEFPDLISRSLAPTSERWPAPSAGSSQNLAVVRGALRNEIEIDQLVGRGGIFIPMKSDFPMEGECVRFQLSLQTGDVPIWSGVGTVRWVRHRIVSGRASGSGIEFLSLDSALRQYCEKRLNENPPISFIPWDCGRL